MPAQPVILIRSLTINVCQLLIVLLTAIANFGFAGEKPVYGSDDRIEMHQAGAALCKVGATVSALIPSKALEITGDGGWLIRSAKTLTQAGWCADERFATQPTGVICSAFLISADTIATAAHCLHATDDEHEPGLNCAEAAFVFDLRIAIDGESPRSFGSNQVYFCASIIAGFESVTGQDWRVARLTRSTGRQALPLYTGNAPFSDGLLIDVVGHSNGLPMKAARNGTVMEQKHPSYFQASLDAYKGNSGSPVILRSGHHAVIVGLLSRGEHDSNITGEGCLRSRICQTGDCDGERVTHANVLAQWASESVSTVSFTEPVFEQDVACLWCSDSLYSRQWQCPAARQAH